MLTLGFEVEVDLPHDQAIERVTEVLGEQGFGVITRLDMQQTFKEKLGQDFHPYTILGVCNPELAHRALTHEPGVGLMLPCNVTVETNGGGRSRVRIANPDGVMAVGDYHGDPVIREVAMEVPHGHHAVGIGDARERLERVLDRLENA